MTIQLFDALGHDLDAELALAQPGAATERVGMEQRPIAAEYRILGVTDRSKRLRAVFESGAHQLGDRRQQGRLVLSVGLDAFDAGHIRYDDAARSITPTAQYQAAVRSAILLLS